MGLGFLLVTGGLEARYRFFQQRDYAVFALADVSVFVPQIFSTNWALSTGLGVEYGGYGIPFALFSSELPDYRTFPVRTLVGFSFGLLPLNNTVRLSNYVAVQFRF